MLSVVDRHVIARESNVVRVDLSPDPDPPAPCFPGANGLRLSDAEYCCADASAAAAVRAVAGDWKSHLRSQIRAELHGRPNQEIHPGILNCWRRQPTPSAGDPGEPFGLATSLALSRPRWQPGARYPGRMIFATLLCGTCVRQRFWRARRMSRRRPSSHTRPIVKSRQASIRECCPTPRVTSRKSANSACSASHLISLTCTSQFSHSKRGTGEHHEHPAAVGPRSEHGQGWKKQLAVTQFCGTTWNPKSTTLSCHGW